MLVQCGRVNMRFACFIILLLCPFVASAQSSRSPQPENGYEKFLGLQANFLGIGLNFPGIEAGITFDSQLALISYFELNTLKPFAEPLEDSKGEFEPRYAQVGFGARFSPWAGSFFADVLLGYRRQQYFETTITAGRNLTSEAIRLDTSIGNKWNVDHFSLGVKWLTLGLSLKDQVRVWYVNGFKSGNEDKESAREIANSRLHVFEPSILDLFVEYRF